jgi:hypothetical protein
MAIEFRSISLSLFLYLRIYLADLVCYIYFFKRENSLGVDWALIDHELIRDDAEC